MEDPKEKQVTRLRILLAITADVEVTPELTDNGRGGLEVKAGSKLGVRLIGADRALTLTRLDGLIPETDEGQAVLTDLVLRSLHRSELDLLEQRDEHASQGLYLMPAVSE